MNRSGIMLLMWALAGAGCERVTRDMAEQPRVDADQPSAFFGNGAGARRAPAGIMAMPDPSPAVDPARAGHALVARGGERYAIYCLPCHGALGKGNGEVVRRGFPAPPVLHARAPLDDAWLAVIRGGRGRMNGFADRITESDARAIVAYLHAASEAPP